MKDSHAEKGAKNQALLREVNALQHVAAAVSRHDLP